MPDGTTKQLNPFTGTEVWAVPGRSSKPVSTSHTVFPKKIELKEKEDYCSFCETRFFETPPEKTRLVKQGNSYVRMNSWRLTNIPKPLRHSEGFRIYLKLLRSITGKKITAIN